MLSDAIYMFCFHSALRISATSGRVWLSSVYTHITYIPNTHRHIDTSALPFQTREATKFLMAASCSPPVPRTGSTGWSCHSPSAIRTVTAGWAPRSRLPSSRITSAKSSSPPPTTKHSLTTPSNPIHHPSSAAKGSLYPSVFFPPRNDWLHNVPR